MSRTPCQQRPACAAAVAVLVGLVLSACSQQPTRTGDAWPAFEEPQARQFAQWCRGGLAEGRAQLERLEAPEPALSDAQLLDAIDELERTTNRVSGRASLYRNVHPEPAVREAADTCQQQLVQLNTAIGLSRPLYRRLSQVDTEPLDAIDRRFVEQMRRDYRRSGVDLPEAERQRVAELNDTINRLGQDFNRNIREDRLEMHVDPERLTGLPDDYIDNRLTDEGRVHITTDYPDYFPVMQYAEDDQLRFELYRLFRQRAYPENEQVLRELLAARFELAQLLGYDNYADYITEIKMIGEPGDVQSFIDRVSDIAQPRAEHDYALLLERLREIDPEAEEVGDWQKFYLEGLIKEETYGVDSRKVRPYFHYDKVRQGIFDLTETLFGVEIRSWDAGDLWHGSVTAHEIVDAGEVVGRFYLDMHPRQGKFNHAAAFTVRSGLQGEQLPLVALVCNFPGGEGSAGYMEHQAVKTFLHEFGHLLHAIFGGHQPRLRMSGIRTERDFVEAPSQMLEEWIWDADTLASFARNAQGEVIPESLVEQMNAARDFGRGLWVQHQMFYSALSLNYYNRDPEQVDLTAMVRQLQEEYSPYPYVEDTYFHTAFGHLYGYSAVYYTYMWSLVMALDMFSEFERHGMLNTEVARRFREQVLAPGGSRDAAELVEDFLGRPYGFAAFARMLEPEQPAHEQ